MQRIWMLCLMVLVGCAVGGPAPDQKQNPYATEPPPIQVVMADAGQPGWPGTCGYTCTDDGWLNTCTGALADCATSKLHCDKLPPACQDAGPCGIVCTAAGPFDTCTGTWWGSCADSLAMCGVAASVCQGQNICYNADPTHATFAVQCGVAGATMSFSWTDVDGGLHDCNDGATCPAGTACTVVDTPGAPLTGVCF